MTELGDAELAEQGVMALSGHRRPRLPALCKANGEAARRAAAKRRSWVEAGDADAKVEMASDRLSGNEGAQTAQDVDFIGTASPARTGDPQIHNLVL